MRFSFRLKIALLTATVSALPLLMAGWMLIDVNGREVESATQALQLALVAQVAELADAELARAEGTLNAIASALGDAELVESARVAASLRLLDADPGIDTVAIYDSDGALIDRMHAPDVSAPTPERLAPDAITRAVEAGRALGTPSIVEGTTRVLLIVPVRAGSEVTGFAAAPWSLSSVQTRVADLSTSQLASREGVLRLVDVEGRALFHPDPTQLLGPGAAPPSESTRAPVSLERIDHGRTWLDTTVGLRTLPWSAVASIPADVAYASLAQMRRIVTTTIGVTLRSPPRRILLRAAARRSDRPTGVLHSGDCRSALRPAGPRRHPGRVLDSRSRPQRCSRGARSLGRENP